MQVEDKANDTNTSFPVPVTDTELTEPGSKRESLYVPDEASQGSGDSLSEDGVYEDSFNDESRKQLNRFLQVRDISPIRHTLTVPWNEAQSRTKRRYFRKAGQCVSAVLDVLAPQDSKCLWGELCESKGNLGITGVKRRQDSELLDAFAESYLNAQHWSTRRQILSMLADKLSFKEVQEILPTVTSYRFNIARHHILLHGRAEPIPSNEKRRMKVDQETKISFCLSQAHLYCRMFLLANAF